MAEDLNTFFKGEQGTIVTYSNLVNSNSVVATATLTGSFLKVEKKSTGSTTDVTFDYTGSNGVTGTITWTYIFE